MQVILCKEWDAYVGQSKWTTRGRRRRQESQKPQTVERA